MMGNKLIVENGDKIHWGWKLKGDIKDFCKSLQIMKKAKGSCQRRFQIKKILQWFFGNFPFDWIWGQIDEACKWNKSLRLAIMITGVFLRDYRRFGWKESSCLWVEVVVDVAESWVKSFYRRFVKNQTEFAFEIYRTPIC